MVEHSRTFSRSPSGWGNLRDTEERITVIQALTKLDGQTRHLYAIVQHFDSANNLYLQGRDINLHNLQQFHQNEASALSW